MVVQINNLKYVPEKFEIPFEIVRELFTYKSEAVETLEFPQRLSYNKIALQSSTMNTDCTQKTSIGCLRF